MNLNMVVYDNNGATRGQMRMKLDFGGTKWSLVEDPGQVWNKIGASPAGGMDVNGSQVGIKGQPPGKLPGVVLLLSNLPQDGAAHAGTGKIVTSTDPSLSDGYVFWAYDEPKLSPVRQAMREVLDHFIPRAVISSDDKEFKDLTGYDTKRLLDEYWEPENKVPPYKTGTMPKKNTGFTCCNLTLGSLAGQLGKKLGKKVGFWLGAGPLQLDLVDKDVKGSWVPSSSGGTPQVGDFYSTNHGAQVFGHVGTIGELNEDGTWVAYDGGQGGYNSGNKHDYIKKVFRGKLDTSRMNGWVDIDIYFG